MLEPPDIGNWFSSYAYESPESCRFSDKETEAEEDCIVNQLKREKERNSWELGLTRITTEVAIDEKVNSNGVLRFKSSSRDDDEQDSLFLNRVTFPPFVQILSLLANSDAEKFRKNKKTEVEGGREPELEGEIELERENHFSFIV